MVEITTDLYDNTVGMAELFADVAVLDPLVALLLVLGTLLVVFSAGLFGVLGVGAILGVIRRAIGDRSQPRPQAR